MSAAVRPGASGSMRMSSGPSCRNEKPRAGSSRCMDDTPRSSRIASAAAIPACAATSAIWSKVAWTRVVCPAKAARRAPARASAPGSRSMPSSRPSGPAAASKAAACPPAPSVPSMITAPGEIARVATTASSRTGRWGCGCSAAVGDRPIVVSLHGPYDTTSACQGLRKPHPLQRRRGPSPAAEHAIIQADRCPGDEWQIPMHNRSALLALLLVGLFWLTRLPALDSFPPFVDEGVHVILQRK